MEFKDYKDVYIFIEQRDGVLADISLELLGKGREIADKTHSKLIAFLLGSNIKGLTNVLVAGGADEVLFVDDACLEHYITEQYVQAAYNIINSKKPNIILIGATSIGRDLAPRLAARLHTGLTADCTKLEVEEDGSLFSTRPAFGGNLMATIISPDNRPQMSTVRPGVFKKLTQDSKRKGKIEEVKVQFDRNKFKVELVEVKKAEVSKKKIEDAKILVSGGRGVGKDNFPTLSVLAETIGPNTTVSGSRAVVDAKIIDQSCQVGQTGKTVHPDVYFALGISGAIQHVAGMEESEYIIAINKDKFAPIFSVADLGIVGDVNKIVPLLIDAIKEAKAKK